LGIIEVKTRIRARSIVDIIDTAGNNGRIIVDGRSSRKIFNGIFSYNLPMKEQTCYHRDSSFFVLPRTGT